MQRIPTLLQKLNELAQNGEKTDIIELDLMMDYTRVLYADLLEWRKRLTFNTSLTGDILGYTPPVQDKPASRVEYRPVPEPQPQPVAPPTPPQPVQKEEIVVPDKPPVIKRTRKDGDINKLIGINDKYQFMSELFSNNRDLYNQSMEEINTMETYEDAISWLDFNVSERYNWKKDEETAQAFYDVLRTFFSAR